MEIIKKLMQENEKIEFSAKVSAKKYMLFRFKSMLLFLFMWLILDGFFIYLLFLENISTTYWFVAIPVAGFNILGLLSAWVGIVKGANFNAEKGYVCTNQAIYSYDLSSYKNVQRISFEDIIRIENAKNGEGFYVCSEVCSIKIVFIEEEKDWQKEIAKRLQKPNEVDDNNALNKAKIPPQIKNKKGL